MKNKENLFGILVVLTGVLFLVSGISKLFPIYAFEFLFVKENITGWGLAPYAARIIIAVELITGIHLCFGMKLKKIFIPLALLLLVVFSLHLVYTIITRGIQANCGCFGELLPMTTSSALVKNLILFIILILCFFNIKTADAKKYGVTAIISALTLAAVFIVFPVRPYVVPVNKVSEKAGEDTVSVPAVEKTVKKDTASILKTSIKIKDTVKTEKTKNISLIDKYKQTVSVYSAFVQYNGVKANPDEGEKIVAVFSLDCEHCMAAAKELNDLKNKIKLPQILVLFLGEEEEVPGFFKTAGGSFIYKIIDPAHFFPLLRNSPPRVSYLINGNVVKNWEGEEFSGTKIAAAITDARKK